MHTDLLRLHVTAYRAEARGIVSVELRDPHGMPLPAFAPGAHIEIAFPPRSGEERGLIRHYSLCNEASETHRYVVAVGLAADSRGGSLAMHETVRVGSRLMVRPPRNNFALVADAGHYRFIAGGIGITPILSMLRWCETHGKSWSLLYCTRNRQRTAFHDELRAYGDRVRFHFRDEQGGPADVDDELSQAKPNEHVYCCGPRSLMLAVGVAGVKRTSGTVHFEWFSAKEVAHSQPAAGAFDIVLRKSGLRLQVKPDRSVLETLEDSGISVPSSCRDGLCRSCETPLCAGEADHRDYVLSDDERKAQKSMIVCVSRSKTPVLELDL
jgi:vanillate O-demethylase ferredoxin subunit